MNGDAEEREKKCRARVLLLWWPNGIRTRVWSRPRFRQTFQPFLGPGDSKKYDRTQTRTIAFLKAFTRRDQDSAPIRFGRALQFDATTLHPSVLRRSKRDSFVMAWPSLRLCRSGSPSLRPTMTLVSRAEFLGVCASAPAPPPDADRITSRSLVASRLGNNSTVRSSFHHEIRRLSTSDSRNLHIFRALARFTPLARPSLCMGREAGAQRRAPPRRGCLSRCAGGVPFFVSGIRGGPG